MLLLSDPSAKPRIRDNPPTGDGNYHKFLRCRKFLRIRDNPPTGDGNYKDMERDAVLELE